MNKEDFKNVISKEVKKLLFEPVEKVESSFDPYIEDGSIEKYEWEYDEKKKTLSVDFFFSDGTKFNIKVTGGK